MLVVPEAGQLSQCSVTPLANLYLQDTSGEGPVGGWHASPPNITLTSLSLMDIQSICS